MKLQTQTKSLSCLLRDLKSFHFRVLCAEHFEDQLENQGVFDQIKSGCLQSIEGFQVQLFGCDSGAEIQHTPNWKAVDFFFKFSSLNQLLQHCEDAAVVVI